MSSKSSVFAVLYALVAIVLLILYGTGVLSSLLGGVGSIAEHTDLLVTLAIFATGLVCYLFGGHGTSIMAIGTVASFIALTLYQSPLVRYLSLAAVLFTLGIYGMVVSRNAVRVLICIELMLNAVNINLVAFSRYIDPVDVKGQLFAIFVLTIAAAEAAVGLAIVLAIYRNQASVDMEKFNLLKW